MQAARQLRLPVERDGEFGLPDIRQLDGRGCVARFGSGSVLGRFHGMHRGFRGGILLL